jgi:hypothetical protein
MQGGRVNVPRNHPAIYHSAELQDLTPTRRAHGEIGSTVMLLVAD